MISNIRWFSLVAFGALAAGLAACSTGTVDRRLFASTQEETYARVRAAVPSGTPVDSAEAAMTSTGWRCFHAPPRTGVTPNDTHQRVFGPVLSCEAHPALGGYPLSKQYDADFLIEGGKVTVLQVTISDPGI